MPQIILILLLCICTLATSNTLRVGFVTDIHIGEKCNGILIKEKCPPMQDIAAAFAKMNTLNLDAVFLSGDLTSSALLEEFYTLRELLGELNVPWWPLLGNHDAWPYTSHDDGTFNQTDTPIGDAYFAQVFGDVLSSNVADERLAKLYINSSTKNWPSQECHNGYYNTFDSWFHNYDVIFPNFSQDFHFLSLDFVARGAALPEPGVGPEVELHDFECGTLDWLTKQLDLIKNEQANSKFFIVQHHPFHNRAALDPFGNNYVFNFTFDDNQDKTVQKVLSAYFPPSAFLGVHSGHNHRWFNGSAFTLKTCLTNEWLSIPEWETPATKGWWLDEAYVSSMTIFTFEADDDGKNAKLSNAEGFWRTPPLFEWISKPAVSNKL